jgi:hypothetical protein
MPGTISWWTSSTEQHMEQEKYPQSCKNQKSKYLINELSLIIFSYIQCCNQEVMIDNLIAWADIIGTVAGILILN